MKFRKKCTVQDASTKDGLWQVSTPAFILVVALGSAILYHFPLYKFAVNNLDISSPGGIWTLLTLFVLVFFANIVALSALSVLSQWLLKPAVMLMAVINSIALYFIVVYGGVLDKTMMGRPPGAIVRPTQTTAFESAARPGADPVPADRRDKCWGRLNSAPPNVSVRQLQIYSSLPSSRFPSIKASRSIGSSWIWLPRSW